MVTVLLSLLTVSGLTGALIHYGRILRDAFDGVFSG